MDVPLSLTGMMDLIINEKTHVFACECLCVCVCVCVGVGVATHKAFSFASVR